MTWKREFAHSSRKENPVDAPLEYCLNAKMEKFISVVSGLVQNRVGHAMD